MTTSPGPWVRAPSNIALVKYWGKSDAERQWPANSSLSMTLRHAATWTRATILSAGDGTSQDDQFVVLTAASPKSFTKATAHLAFLRSILAQEPVPVATPPLQVETGNTFPSDCGIASSASGLAALTLAALSTWLQVSSFEELAARGFDRARLAQLARQGSGSAGRSLFGHYVRWERRASANDQVITPCAGADWPLADVIVLVNQNAKAMSSTDAHRAAWTSPLFAPRLAGMESRLARVEAALAARDLTALGYEIEAEALDMHAVAMTSQPACHFWQEETPAMLAFIRQERHAGRLPAWFTIDAGPNLHLICAPADAVQVAASLKAAFPQVDILQDETGAGPDFPATGPHEFAMKNLSQQNQPRTTPTDFSARGDAP